MCCCQTVSAITRSKCGTVGPQGYCSTKAADGVRAGDRKRDGDAGGWRITEKTQKSPIKIKSEKPE